MSARYDANAPSPLIIGIDLGTTYSSIACYKHGKIEIISDKYSKRIIPSLVYFDPNTGEVSVGTSAYNKSKKYPKNLLKDSKRILGRKFNDASLSKYKQEKSTFNFDIVEGSEGEAAFQIEVNGKKIVKTPEEVSAEILKYLKAIAKEYLMEDVTEAVISIPAHFSNAQRKATKKAAELAGLTVTKFVTEPVAGAICYSLNKNMKSKLAVFDWGGGTLDISFIELDNKTFEVKSVYGDTLLGGRDIDDILFKHFEKSVTRNPFLFQRRLLENCIKIKKELSVSKTAEFEIDAYDGINDLSLNLTRTEFEKLNEKVFEAAMDLMKYGVHDIGWDKSEINEVVLIGGSTRIPKIRKMLEIFFGNDKIKTDLHPDEAVVCGACIQAANLNELNDLENIKLYKLIRSQTSKNASEKENINDRKLNDLQFGKVAKDTVAVNSNQASHSKIDADLLNVYFDKSLKITTKKETEISKELVDLDKYKITEITPLSIGFGGDFGLMHVIIPRNSKLPVDGVMTLSTDKNNLDVALFDVYEGERSNANCNNKLACLKVRNIPLGRVGKEKVKLKFKLDLNGILTLSFKILSTNEIQHETIHLDEQRLTQNRIAKSIEEAKKMKQEDNLFKSFAILKRSIKKSCCQLLYDIERISSTFDRNFVEETCKDFIKKMSKFDYNEEDEFKKELESFRESIKCILVQNSLSGLLP